MSLIKALFTTFVLASLSATASAVDTTPPTLDVPHAWIEKTGSIFHFRMLLDPKDDVGFDPLHTLYFRSALNTTAALPDSKPWLEADWKRGVPFEQNYNCTAIVVELKVKDAAGNFSPMQRRTFKAPFPLSSPPSLNPKFGNTKPHGNTAMDCRGLFTGNFDGIGGDDVLQVDRTSSTVVVRRQNSPAFVENSFTVGAAAGSIEDSAVADIDGDGRLDLALVADGTLIYYHNDGPDGNDVLQFSVSTPSGLINSGITTVSHVVAGDITGEGKPDLIVSGTGDDGQGGAATKVAVLINDATWQLNVSNNALAPAGASAGRMAVGDLTGDGAADVVMINTAGRKIAIFKNKGNGSLAGDNDSDTSVRPAQYTTGLSYFPIAADAVAVGDVTGDDKPDVVLSLREHVYLGNDRYSPRQYWQLFDNRGEAGLRVNGYPMLSAGIETGNAAPEEFRTDLTLQDLNGDRFPELIFTNQYETGTAGQPLGGIRAICLIPKLDAQNLLTTFTYTEAGFATGIASPCRITTGRLGSSAVRDVVLASNASPPLVWISNTYSATAKPLDLIGGASTDSDSTGSLSSTGIATYQADIGDRVNYTMAYINDTPNDLPGSIIECVIPANVTVETSDAGNSTVTVGSVKYLRWTQDIDAGTAGVKSFVYRINSGKVGSFITPTAYLRQSGKTLVTTAMPKIELNEPLKFRLTATSDSDVFVGLRAHIGERITYTMKVTNQSAATVGGFKLGMSIPANTTYESATTSPAAALTGKAPNFTAVNWTGLTLAAGEIKEFQVNVRVKETTADGAIIKNSTATLTRSDNTKQVAQVFSTTIEPPLEITLSQNKNIVQPGDVIRYTLSVRNWLPQPVTSARVVNVLPVGTSLHAVALFDNADAPDGKGNFSDWSASLPGSSLSPSTIPALDRELGILSWNLGKVPGATTRTMEYDALVKQDIPTFAFMGGVNTTLEVKNVGFNFVATSPGGKRLFAYKPALGNTVSAPVNAPAAYLVSSLGTVRRAPLSNPPLTPCNLTLDKKAAADGVQIVANERIYSLINDTKVSDDGVMDYVLEFANKPLHEGDPAPGPGRNVVIRDYVPAGMTFLGFVARDGVLVNSYFGFKFYDANGKIVPNGTPANLVRSMELPVGDLAGGASGMFTYRVVTTSAPGAVIISKAGGMTGVKDGLSYTPVTGFQMTADNLHFPVMSGTKEVKVKITAPANFTFPAQAVKSRTTLADNQSATISFPYQVQGAEGIALSGVKMEMMIPKGYLVAAAQIFNTLGNEVKKFVPGAPDNTITVGNPDKTGARKITLPFDTLRTAFPLIKLALDPATKNSLKNAAGQTRAPLLMTPAITGQYIKPPSPAPLAAAGKGAPPPAGPPAPLPLTAATLTATLPTQVDSTVDSKIFVGRVAPISVRRGEVFSYTIFVGNLTRVLLGKGTVEMTIPAGCDFVSATKYSFNGLSSDNAVEIGGEFGKLPARSGSRLTWDIGNFYPLEGGAVTLTLKLREDFNGTRIDDNSCTFDVVNACGKTPGPLGIVVRAGNEITQTASIVQSAAQGLQLQYSENVRSGLMKQFSFTTASAFITCGGADNLQVNNGTLVIQMLGGRALAVGPPDKVLTTGTRLVKNDSLIRVAAGPGDAGGVELTKLPTMAASVVMPANMVLNNLHNPATSLVAAGAGNIVAAGAGNMVAAGAGNLVGTDAATLVGTDGASLVGTDGATMTNIKELADQGGARLVGTDGATMVAAGAGNMVAAGAGNIVAAGAGNLVGTDAATLVGTDAASIVAAGAGNLIGQDGANVVAAGAGNIFSTNTGNLIQANGLITSPNKF